MSSKSKTVSTKRPIVLLTGMSGAGLSTALKVFEDLGFEAVDNLRLGLVPELVEASSDARGLAIAVDTRNASFSVDEILRIQADLSTNDGVDVKIVFLECSDEALQQRFTETRRRHPMAIDRPVTDGIKREREMLWRLRDEADHVIDTSTLSLHDLRRLIVGHFRFESDSGLLVFVTSFSYRHGLPREADLVFDVRFLANPYWDPALRSLSGKDPGVGAYIEKDQGYESFIGTLKNLLLPLLPRYQAEGKNYLTIAVGCTGGRHRSVFVAETLATIVASAGYIVGVGHRDLDRAGAKG